MVSVAARKVAGRFRGYTERADVEQELTVWVAKNHSLVARWIWDDQTEEERKEGAIFLHIALMRAGGRFARKEKARSVGYETRDEAFYDSGVVEMALPAVFDDSHILARGTEDESAGRSKTALNETGNSLAIVADVKAAYANLPLSDKSLLLAIYGCGDTQRSIAEEESVAESTISRRVDAAMKRIVENLGGDSPWSQGPGARRVIRNSQAIAITSQQEVGE